MQDILRWPTHLQRVIDAKGAKVPKKKRAKSKRAREFIEPPDCPMTTAALHAEFSRLDPPTPCAERVLPPKKRTCARRRGEGAP